ncbi:hypothetical protein FHX37_2128 [Haloactinospora alba]|uniref:DDE superfamily endonuclease n=1 Tax=Haloactinospora alba TaxID=405555 RepID=A0A543NJZ4_9ACTN|nr:hypothetical protein FHX37_2128 [Haloactinospora alba]
MLSYPSGMNVSSRALGVLADALRAHRKAFVILDGTLLRIDRVAMTSGTTARSTAASTNATG